MLIATVYSKTNIKRNSKERTPAQSADVLALAKKNKEMFRLHMIVMRR